jgi:elongation factor P--beta-lysine ligase
VDTDHNPEFSMVEIYWAYRDFTHMMALTEDIVSSIVFEVHGKFEIPFGKIPLDFKAPWRKISMADAVKEYAGIDIFAHSVDELRILARQHKLEEPDKPQSQREFLIAFFEGLVEEKLIQPTFIHDYPVENSPLAKRHRSKEGFTERFELFIAGMEVGNGFSELNDPVDQKERFEAQDEKRRLGDVEAQMIDYDFINAIGYGMPPTGGVGIGIDRLVMLLTNNDSIKEVILFPSMKKFGAITIVARGSQSYNIGDKIELSGTSTVGRDVFLRLKTPKTTVSADDSSDFSILNTSDQNDEPLKIEVNPDHTWSFIWDTSKFASRLREGTYTIYAIENQSTLDNISGTIHGTISIILKK